MDPADIEAIDVLLIDDDPDWLELTASLLERYDDAIDVRTASGGWEALDRFDEAEDAPVDCVVCDYRMPNMDGITVLERIRSKDHDLPFILVTSEGDESVASKAISSEVTDYFVKDPGQDQARDLAARIRSAVTTHRTERQLAVARRRFTGLFENVPDPAVVVDGDGTVERVNDAFARTFDVQVDDESPPGLPELLGTEGEDLDGEDGTGVRTIRTATGSREFLVRQVRLLDDDPAVAYLLTDLSQQRDRQEDLRRALALDADVRELLLSAATRTELERSFCDRVVESGDRLAAVVAERGRDGTPDVRADAGDDAAALVGDGAGPLGTAIESSTTSYVPETADVDEKWARRVLEAGVHSVLAVPIDRNGVSAGAFAVYDARPDAYDEETRSRFEALVDSLGDAVDLVERMGALSADRVIRTRLSVRGDGPLARATADLDAPVDVTAVTRTEAGTALYLDVPEDEVAAFRESLADEQAVERVETVIDGPTTRLRAATSGQTLPGLVADRGGSIDELRVEDGTYAVTVDVPPSGDVSAVVDDLEGEFDRATVHAIENYDRDPRATAGPGPLSQLTDRQLDALEAAYYQGYFERPRQNSSEVIADSLSISSTTFLEHLREAEQKVLTAILTGTHDEE